MRVLRILFSYWSDFRPPVQSKSSVLSHSVYFLLLSRLLQLRQDVATSHLPAIASKIFCPFFSLYACHDLARHCFPYFAIALPSSRRALAFHRIHVGNFFLFSMCAMTCLPYIAIALPSSGRALAFHRIHVGNFLLFPMCAMTLLDNVLTALPSSITAAR